MKPEQKLNLIRIPFIFFGLMLLLFSYYVYELYSGGDIERYHLQDKLIDMYLIIAIPFVLLGAWFIWKRKQIKNKNKTDK